MIEQLQHDISLSQLLTATHKDNINEITKASFAFEIDMKKNTIL